MSSALSRIAERLPGKTFVHLVALQYRILEPELRQLEYFVPRAKTPVMSARGGALELVVSPRVEAFEPNASI